MVRRAAAPVIASLINQETRRTMYNPVEPYFSTHTYPIPFYIPRPDHFENLAIVVGPIE
jgi:hypothetical protein